MVITRRTRNPLAFRGPWVRIPPAPPSKSFLPFSAKSFFAWKDLFSDASPHPQPVNKAQNALPEIRRAVHHSRVLPSSPLPMYINACPSGTPQRKRKIPEQNLAAARYMEISAPSCVNSNRSHTYPHRDPARDILPSGNSPPLRSVYISFTVSYSIVAVADDRTLRSRKTLLAISFPTWFMTHDPPRKKSH